MTSIFRFAPSPTGRLHLGNARTALVNWLFARRTGGRFLLRLDDTDRERSTAEYAAGIERDLAWLGLDWDGFVRQSDRLDRYSAAAEALKREGRLYPCFETAEELALKRKLAQSRGKAWIYDRAALAIPRSECEERLRRGEQPHWRFKLEPAPISWTDLVRGPVEFHGSNLSDPVLIRADGMPLYTLSSVVDDAELGVTHIVRGEDHVANTAVQIQIFEALGASVPEFAHLSLIAGAGGEMLSKRLGSLSLSAIAEDGIEPMAVASLLAKLGTSDPVEPRLSMAALVAEFEISKFGRAQPRLDPSELIALNAKLLHATPFEAVADRLPPGASRAFWEAVRPNLERQRDVAWWWRVCTGEIEPAADDPAYLAEAATLLPSGPLGAGAWKEWTERVKAATGRKGRALYQPLRRALTGRDHGPEMQALLPLIGRERVLARLRREAG